MTSDISITARLQKEGKRLAEQMRKQDQRFIAKILAPKEVQGGDTIPLRAVVIKPDWKIAAKLEMVESGTDIITRAYIVGALDPAFPTKVDPIIKTARGLN